MSRQMHTISHVSRQFGRLWCHCSGGSAWPCILNCRRTVSTYNYSKGRPFRRIFVSQLALSPKKDHPSIGGQGIFLKAVERSESTPTMGQTFTKHAGHSEEDEGIPWQRDLTLEGHEGGLQRYTEIRRLGGASARQGPSSLYQM